MLAGFCLTSAFSADAENVLIDGKTYQMDRLIERQIGPGTTYLRLRFPEIPLNINMVIADMTNEYVRVENSVAKESAKGVEGIATAATRLSTSGHKAIAGRNANFGPCRRRHRTAKCLAAGPVMRRYATVKWLPNAIWAPRCLLAVR